MEVINLTGSSNNNNNNRAAKARRTSSPPIMLTSSPSRSVSLAPTEPLSTRSRSGTPTANVSSRPRNSNPFQRAATPNNLKLLQRHNLAQAAINKGLLTAREAHQRASRNNLIRKHMGLPTTLEIGRRLLRNKDPTLPVKQFGMKKVIEELQKHGLVIPERPAPAVAAAGGTKRPRNKGNRYSSMTLAELHQVSKAIGLPFDETATANQIRAALRANDLASIKRNMLKNEAKMYGIAHSKKTKEELARNVRTFREKVQAMVMKYGVSLEDARERVKLELRPPPVMRNKYNKKSLQNLITLAANRGIAHGTQSTESNLRKLLRAWDNRQPKNHLTQLKRAELVEIAKKYGIAHSSRSMEVLMNLVRDFEAKLAASGKSLENYLRRDKYTKMSEEQLRNRLMKAGHSVAGGLNVEVLRNMLRTHHEERERLVAEASTLNVPFKSTNSNEVIAERIRLYRELQREQQELKNKPLNERMAIVAARRLPMVWHEFEPLPWPQSIPSRNHARVPPKVKLFREMLSLVKDYATFHGLDKSSHLFETLDKSIAGVRDKRDKTVLGFEILKMKTNLSNSRSARRPSPPPAKPPVAPKPGSVAALAMLAGQKASMDAAAK